MFDSGPNGVGSFIGGNTYIGLQSRPPPLLGEEEALGWFSVCMGLVGLHYGVGFLIGTAEKVYYTGPSGSIYAVSASLGLLFLALYAPLYHRLRDRIEFVMARKYEERSIGGMIAFLSWLWMLGITGAQILGVTYIVSVWGILDLKMVMAGIALLIWIVSLLDLRRMTLLFRGLLLISTLGIVLSLLASQSIGYYVHSIQAMIPSYLQASPGEILGISTTTILLTMIGMDFHQFIVRAKGSKESVMGCVAAASLLFLMAFLPTSTSLAAKDMGITPLGKNDGKTILPLFLLEAGESIKIYGVGLVFAISLLAVALNSGAGLNRAMSLTLRDFLDSYAADTKRPGAHPLKNLPIPIVALLNVSLALGVAIAGKTMIDVIVTFYAIYVAGVFNPFLAFILEDKGLARFSARAISLSIAFGAVSALLTLVYWLLTGEVPLSSVFQANVELAMTSLGLALSALPLVMDYLRLKGWLRRFLNRMRVP